MKSKRFLCLLLVLLMVFSLTPSETRAETTVYFTAVNDQLLPDLSDETMPFWSGGRLYVPSTVITGTDLGLFYSRSRDKSTAVVYRQGSALTFNFAAGTVADQNDRQYSGPAIVRSDVVFLPLDLLTQFFSLDYSYTRVTYGYLVRVKSNTVVLSDAKFIDAAAMSMEQRYNEYMKTHSESNDPGNTPNQNTDGDRDLVCLALRVTDEESAKRPARHARKRQRDGDVSLLGRAAFLARRSAAPCRHQRQRRRAAHRRFRRQLTHGQRDRARKQRAMGRVQRKSAARRALRRVGQDAARRARRGLLPH